MILLKQQQLKILKHAFKCKGGFFNNDLVPNIKLVLYITRSIHPQENENIVQELKDILGSGWRLEPVLPEISFESHYDYEIGNYALNLI